MKKILILYLMVLFLLSSATSTHADSGWEVSLQEWDLAGFFDYTLYYPDSAQVISKVSLPQNQSMNIFKARYTFANEKNFMMLQYGWTGSDNKGRGSDWDWRIAGSDIITDYGNMDAYGKQKMGNINFGTVLIKKEAYQAKMLLGWIQQETTNELKNIVYHLLDGNDVGDRSQPDNGSYLNGEFQGLSLGIINEFTLSSKLKLTTDLSLSQLRAEAEGHWANHTPAWNWENIGNTVGYKADIALKYALNINVQAEFGYYYNYAEFSGCSETFNGVLIPQLVDLEYVQKGLHASVIFLF